MTDTDQALPLEPTLQQQLATMPSTRWTPRLRVYVNHALSSFAGDDDVASKFASPRECADYYAERLLAPMSSDEEEEREDVSSFADYLDALDERAGLHWAPDLRNNETTLNGRAMAEGMTMADALSTGTCVRFATIGGRDYPRFRRDR